MSCKSWLAALLAGTASFSVQANRPLTTDTADTIAHHRCQFEPYAASTRSSGSPTLQTTILQLNCGVREDTQLGVAYGRGSAAGLRVETFSAAGKTNLIELKDRQTGVAVAYGLGAAKDDTSGWKHVASWTTLIATRSLREGLLAHANLGWSRSQSAKQNSTTWALALEWTAAPKLTLSAETYGDDRGKPWVGGGIWSPLTEQFSVNASFGVQTSNPRVRQITAGFNFEF
ncbi:hypothetical protein [Piscinibacter sp.]|jgi:hypothetical protein|uniref:hypothetical protein n=1 Tax=Piscinibacter sp. TaxID=1903157 RepID=UPI002F400A29